MRAGVAAPTKVGSELGVSGQIYNRQAIDKTRRYMPTQSRGFVNLTAADWQNEERGAVHAHRGQPRSGVAYQVAAHDTTTHFGRSAAWFTSVFCEIKVVKV
jgi:hypothetical protein